MRTVSFVVHGEPKSKANSRDMVWIKDRRTGRQRILFKKSDAALAYEREALKRIPLLNPLFLGKVRVTVRIFYASERPDLDPSLLFDCMQGRVIKNDRQIREQHLYHAIDREFPRAVVVVEALEQGDMLVGL